MDGSSSIFRGREAAAYYIAAILPTPAVLKIRCCHLRRRRRGGDVGAVTHSDLALQRCFADNSVRQSTPPTFMSQLEREKKYVEVGPAGPAGTRIAS